MKQCLFSHEVLDARQQLYGPRPRHVIRWSNNRRDSTNHWILDGNDQGTQHVVHKLTGFLICLFFSFSTECPGRFRYEDKDRESNRDY